MPRFVKKPVEVEAVQWTGQPDSAYEIGLFMGATEEKPLIHTPSADAEWQGTLTIPTLEGDMTASVGDWIIKGVAGEFYPCKPDIFEATYEPVERPLEEIQAEMVEKALRWQFEYAGLDLNDPDNKQAFLDALREHGIPCGG